MPTERPGSGRHAGVVGDPALPQAGFSFARNSDGRGSESLAGPSGYQQLVGRGIQKNYYLGRFSIIHKKSFKDDVSE
jgi:hypothetical protein